MHRSYLTIFAISIAVFLIAQPVSALSSEVSLTDFNRLIKAVRDMIKVQVELHFARHEILRHSHQEKLICLIAQT
ncbi:hypothetical protein BDV96DRAFT_567487 [Lophiotrema nucula]|uniref:Fungal N-terminal domain-containing protein n=1 Tax=Lophiotrema nucula TaxID=690887 RepID=A0A6A5ZKL6_9PLEO|nr:hypothetical protein BDV96DRAFT_567487 [Lophiotrema nucula]